MPALSGRAKAAIIVRLLASEGARLPLHTLPEHLQASLTEEIAGMRHIDRDTLRAVVEEFCGHLDSIGLSFSGGIDGALALLDGQISEATASKLRQRSGKAQTGDPWDRISAVDTKRLVPALEQESIEVGAVVLSKLAIPKAAEILGRLPGDRARRIAFAMSQTGAVDADTIRRIGTALASQFDAVRPPAFETGPVERVGAILNFSPANTREDVLTGLDASDAGFANEVRKAIFTFTNIPVRIDPRDIPKIIRAVDQAVLVAAIAGATGEDGKSAEFILANMSQRLAASIRDEATALGTVKAKDAEAAKAAVVAGIRNLEAAGEVFFVAAEEE